MNLEITSPHPLITKRHGAREMISVSATIAKGACARIEYGLSDPLIFGDENNINILKDRKYLRADQFNFWDSVPPNIESFVEPEHIVNKIIL